MNAQRRAERIEAQAHSVRSGQERLIRANERTHGQTEKSNEPKTRIFDVRMAIITTEEIDDAQLEMWLADKVREDGWIATESVDVRETTGVFE